jgi:hypothetical protein
MSILQTNEQMRLARMEAMCNQIRAEMDDVLHEAYQTAVNDQDENRAADLARQIRNRMLVNSDSEFAFDRFGLYIPENITATNMLTVLKGVFTTFRNMVCGDWANYRSALRNIPEQQGFPFDIQWPVAPSGTDNGETET